MSGRIDPSPRTVDGLARILGLDGGQREFLALLFMLRRFRHEGVRDAILDGYFAGRETFGPCSAIAEL